MPFMLGKSPIRRTLKYLKAGKIIFKDNVKIFSVNYNNCGEHHKGAKDFVFWYLPQIQFKNPLVQCVCFNNLTPSPFIKVFFECGKSILIDIDSRKKEEIFHHLLNLKILCKSHKEIAEEKKYLDSKMNHGYFGYGCKRHCICEILGQVPCPGLVPLPKSWKGIPNKLKNFEIPPFFRQLD